MIFFFLLSFSNALWATGASLMAELIVAYLRRFALPPGVVTRNLFRQWFDTGGRSRFDFTQELPGRFLSCGFQLPSRGHFSYFLGMLRRSCARDYVPPLRSSGVNFLSLEPRYDTFSHSMNGHALSQSSRTPFRSARDAVHDWILRTPAFFLPYQYTLSPGFQAAAPVRDSRNS